MEKIDDHLLKLMDDVLDDLNQTFRHVDSVRNNVFSKMHDVFSRVREVFSLLYTRELEVSKEKLEEVIVMLKEIDVMVKQVDIKDYLFRTTKDIYREFSEALLLYTYLSNDASLLKHLDIVKNEIFIEAFFEFLGEIRRILIDDLIRGRIESVKRHIDFMDSSYNILFSSYFPNYFFPDYKRRLDILRSQLEKSKEDYLLYLRRRGDW